MNYIVLFCVLGALAATIFNAYWLVSVAISRLTDYLFAVINDIFHRMMARTAAKRFTISTCYAAHGNAFINVMGCVLFQSENSKDDPSLLESLFLCVFIGWLAFFTLMAFLGRSFLNCTGPRLGQSSGPFGNTLERCCTYIINELAILGNCAAAEPVRYFCIRAYALLMKLIRPLMSLAWRIVAVCKNEGQTLFTVVFPGLALEFLGLREDPTEIVTVENTHRDEIGIPHMEVADNEEEEPITTGEPFEDPRNLRLLFQNPQKPACRQAQLHQMPAVTPADRIAAAMATAEQNVYAVNLQINDQRPEPQTFGELVTAALGHDLEIQAPAARERGFPSMLEQRRAFRSNAAAKRRKAEKILGRMRFIIINGDGMRDAGVHTDASIGETSNGTQTDPGIEGELNGPQTDPCNGQVSGSIELDDDSDSEGLYYLTPTPTATPMESNGPQTDPHDGGIFGDIYMEDDSDIEGLYCFTPISNGPPADPRSREISEDLEIEDADSDGLYCLTPTEPNGTRIDPHYGERSEDFEEEEEEFWY